MQLSYINIKNFKYIRDLVIRDMDEVVILVGKNNTGKTTVVDAIRLVCGEYKVRETDFLDPSQPIIIEVTFSCSEEDLRYMHRHGLVSRYKKYDIWYRDICKKLPSFVGNQLSFTCSVSKDNIYYDDGTRKNNPYVKEMFPKLYYIDHERNIRHMEENVLHMYDNQFLEELISDQCILDTTKCCDQCFDCIAFIQKKMPQDLTAYETRKLLEYKVSYSRLNELSKQVTNYFHQNGSTTRDIRYQLEFRIREAIKVHTQVWDQNRNTYAPIGVLSEGFKSMYVLSLLEAYIQIEQSSPSIIMIEDPELFLHPEMQKIAGEIILRLSKKNQVIFTTHSPSMISNFTSRQIKQTILDSDGYTVVNEQVNVDDILDDLGYSASDVMNVGFVFIVEGKQDQNRLPMLLEKYYSEIYDDKGKLQRIAIIPTNSCTNIKTYANLKYMNKLYLRDQFLMIRDSDGKNPKQLVKQLCSYYGKRESEERGELPRVRSKNVLILKYYSFENYFLDPTVMSKIGVIKNEQELYQILYNNYKEYLYQLPSMKRMCKQFNIQIRSMEDIKLNMEQIKIYVRGHNLFDIYYGKYRGKAQEEILKKYIEEAPRTIFSDILDAIDAFIYFKNRKKDSY